MIKAVFINAGNDNDEAGNANISSFPPLGIISMASMVKEKLGNDVEVILFDGQIDSCDFVCQRIFNEKPDIVLVSMYCTGIFYALRCAHAGHEIGSLVVLGNDHAMAHYDTLLKAIPDIDIISLEEYGELTAFYLCDALLRRKNPYSISNIAYLQDGDIKINHIIDGQYKNLRVHPLDNIPLPDRRLLKKHYWDTYLQNFIKVKSKFCDKSIATGVTTMNRARGCLNVNHRCAYCGIRDLSIQKASGSSFWADIRKAHEEVAANFFYECYDNFTSSISYLDEFIEAKPTDIDDCHLCVYSSANRVSQEICAKLKTLGVYLVNLGLDSADERGLRVLKGTNTCVEDNYRAVDLLTKNQIEMHVSFVLMGMGSNELTKHSLDKTLEFIKYLVQNTSVTSVDCALLYPDRTAPVGGLLWYPDNYKIFKDKYSLSYIHSELLPTLKKMEG